MNEPIFGALASARPQRARPQPQLIDRPPPAAARVAVDEPAAVTGVDRSSSGANVLSRAPASWATSCDVALIAIIDAPLRAGETAAVGFARKEAELRGVLATLSIAESRALHLRLANPKTGDQLAASFMRLTAERRARLINFVADARRRAAIRNR